MRRRWGWTAGAAVYVALSVLCFAGWPFDALMKPFESAPYFVFGAVLVLLGPPGILLWEFWPLYAACTVALGSLAGLAIRRERRSRALALAAAAVWLAGGAYSFWVMDAFVRFLRKVMFDGQ